MIDSQRDAKGPEQKNLRDLRASGVIYYRRIQMKKIGICLILIMAAALLFAQQADEKKYKLMEFRNANINSVLNYVSDITGITIITHPDLKGNVTIINKEDLTQDQIMEILYSTLRDLGFTMEKQNNIYTVVPLSQEKIKTEIRTDEDISKLPDGAQIITYIITLKYVNADSIINNIKPFISKYGNVTVNNKMNKVILTDSASNVKKIFQVIKELDKQGNLMGKETEIIYLKHITLDKMESIILGGFYDLKIIDTANPAMQKISPRSDNQKEPSLRLIKLPEANAFIAIGTREEIDNIKNFIAKLDIEVATTASNTKFVIIPLKFLNPKKMIDLINDIFSSQGQSPQAESWRKNNQTAQKSSPLGPDTRIMEFPERNSIIFIGTEDDYKKIMEVVNVFEKEIKDTGFKAGEIVTKVYHLQNQKADDISTILRSIYSSSSGVAFNSDKDINCIIVSAPGEKIYEINKMIDELDKKLAQVLIKILIVEVTFSDQTQMGVDWNAIANLNKEYQSITPSINVAQKFGTAATSGITIQTPSTAGIAVILNALQSLGTVNVLSTPQILTLDNKDATINIGKKIAFITETLTISGADQQNATTSKKVDYRDVGLILKVKPQINDEKTVTMDINQTVNDTEPSGNPDYPNIITRELTSTIMVGDHQTAVLGGLISSKNSVDTKQIPFLGYIPILGYLFKTETVKKEKTELVLFITPYVILSSDDSRLARDETLKRTTSLTPEQMKEITNNTMINTRSATNEIQ
jgi:general secretion pathway protein D